MRRQKRLNIRRQLHLGEGQANGEQDDKDNCKHLRDGQIQEPRPGRLGDQFTHVIDVVPF